MGGGQLGEELPPAFKHKVYTSPEGLTIGV